MKLYSIYYNHNRLNLTMRRHLKSSYSKTGVFNKGEFIQILFLIVHLLYGVG